MKSFNGKMFLGLIGAGLLISLNVGNAFAGDRDGGWDRDHHRAHYVVREYRPVDVQPEVIYVAPAPVVVAPAPVIVAPVPVVEYVAPAPVVREQVVVRHKHWSLGLWFGF